MFGAAAAYHFSSLGDVTLIVPPPGFQPLTASPETLRAWGFTPQPTGPGPRAAWVAALRHYRTPTATPTMCVRDHMSNALPTSYNWSGVVAENASGSLRRVYASARVPTFAASCSGRNDLSLWVGVGGVNSTGLIQNGYTTTASALQGMAPWWELFDNGNPVPATHTVMLGYDSVPAGDLVRSDTYYQGSQVNFNWSDLTTGVTPGQVIVKGVSSGGTTYPVSDYYNGSTAEVIDERPTYNGSLEQLRNYGEAGWKDAYVAPAGGSFAGINAGSHYGMKMINSAGNVLSDLLGEHTLSATNWEMVWSRCG
jgi:Peptidase A4 family